MAEQLIRRRRLRAAVVAAAVVAATVAALTTGAAVAATPAKPAAKPPAKPAAKPAAPQTVKLGWTEKLNKDKATRITFTVADLTTSASAWSATITVTNHSSGKLTIASTQFGLGEFGTAKDYKTPLRILGAAAFSNPVPKTIAPGATWKSTISGFGVPDQHRYVRLILGLFVTASSPTPFTWITDHYRHVFAVVI